MEGLRNPFAVRNGNIILIEDLTANERGLKCRCQCPACEGEFIARMGDVKVHHFAHSKDACDEVLAYTSGLYRLIHQILSSGSPFYVPALAVSYSMPYNGVINEKNAASYIRIVEDSSNSKNKVSVSPGRLISFESAEIVFDSKNHMQAIELSYLNSKMAIKVMPPDTVCKTGDVSPHKDIATLVLDFSVDANIIQSSNSDTFKAYLLSENLSKRWVQNAKIRKVYPKIFAMSEKVLQEQQERERQREAERKIAAKQYEENRRLIEQQRAVQNEKFENKYNESRETDRNTELEKQKEMITIGYQQVKDEFVQQTSQIRDSYGIRWVQCELCGEIKRETEFSSYGGTNHINLGKCNVCSRAREWSSHK